MVLTAFLVDEAEVLCESLNEHVVVARSNVRHLSYQVTKQPYRGVLWGPPTLRSTQRRLGMQPLTGTIIRSDISSCIRKGLDVVGLGRGLRGHWMFGVGGSCLLETPPVHTDLACVQSFGVSFMSQCDTITRYRYQCEQRAVQHIKYTTGANLSPGNRSEPHPVLDPLSSSGTRLDVSLDATKPSRRRSLSLSSGFPSRVAHPSTYRNVCRLQILFIKNSRTGTRMMMIIGNPGAATVNVTPKTIPVSTICASV